MHKGGDCGTELWCRRPTLLWATPYSEHRCLLSNAPMSDPACMSQCFASPRRDSSPHTCTARTQAYRTMHCVTEQAATHGGQRLRNGLSIGATMRSSSSRAHQRTSRSGALDGLRSVAAARRRCRRTRVTSTLVKAWVWDEAASLADHRLCGASKRSRGMVQVKGSAERRKLWLARCQSSSRRWDCMRTSRARYR